MEREVSAANELLDRIDAVTKCEKHMIGGNHEDRYEAFRTNHGFEVSIRRMKDFTSWDKEYNLKKRGWAHVDYGKNIQIGKIVFTHGWYASTNAAAKMAQCFPGRNVIFGHTHRHLIYGCLDERDLPIESESIGTLSRFDLSYLRGKPPTDWIHSFLYIDILDNGYFTKHYVRIIDGGFIEYGKEFR